MYAWEPSFSQFVRNIRERELYTLRIQAYLQGGIGVLSFCAPYLVSDNMFT